MLFDVVEAQAPDTAVGVDVRRGDKVGVVSVLLALSGIPGAIFGSSETRDSGADRGILDLARCEIGDIAQVDQAEGALADEARGGDTEPEEVAFFVDRGAVYGNLHAVKVALGKTGLFDGMTCLRLLAHVDADLPREL